MGCFLGCSGEVNGTSLSGGNLETTNRKSLITSEVFSFMFLLKMESHLVFTQILCLFCFRYFRHATGSLVILSKNLAQYININRLVFPHCGKGFNQTKIGSYSLIQRCFNINAVDC